MDLGELRELLAEYGDLPDSTPVILQKDGEGNYYSPLDGGDRGMYLADGTYSGEVYHTKEQIAATPHLDEEDEAPEESVPCLVLWPVN